jgi:hypothetical protein
VQRPVLHPRRGDRPSQAQLASAVGLAFAWGIGSMLNARKVPDAPRIAATIRIKIFLDNIARLLSRLPTETGRPERFGA